MKRILLILCGTALALAVRGNAITVPNFSFELPAQANGGNDNGGNGNTTAIANWTITSANTNNGVYHPAGGFTSTNPLPAPADGNQVAFLTPDAGNTSSITTSASLGTVAMNTLYTLTVALGNRSDGFTFTGVYTIDLLANGVSVAESTLAGSTIALGTFSDLSAAFTSPASGPLIGESLTIKLSATAGTSATQGIFDNVRLTSAVPEPGVPAMIVAGIGMFVLRQRRCCAATFGLKFFVRRSA